MYVVKGTEVSIDTMLEHIEKAIISFNSQNRNTIVLSAEEAHAAANSLCELNHALITSASVWAHIEKAPRNLDSGKHYFTIWYTKIDNDIPVKTILWCYDFTRALGGVSQNKDRSMRKYVFDSGAIGMNRVLDATDGVFNFLRKVSGTYAQLS